MNTAIVYSSITGNTKRIAESLKLSLSVRKVNSYHASYGHPDDEDIKTIVDSAKKIVYELN